MPFWSTIYFCIDSFHTKFCSRLSHRLLGLNPEYRWWDSEMDAEDVKRKKPHFTEQKGIYVVNIFYRLLELSNFNQLLAHPVETKRQLKRQYIHIHNISHNEN